MTGQLKGRVRAQARLAGRVWVSVHESTSARGGRVKGEGGGCKIAAGCSESCEGMQSN